MHARADAFPLGLAMLTRRGVTAWHRTITNMTDRTAAATPHDAAAESLDTLPTGISIQLIDALAGLTRTGA